jgi:uncharacterized membrane protein YvbJ
MRCSKCGSENPEGKILCRVCGTRLRPSQGTPRAAGRGQSAIPFQSDEELRRRVSFDLVRIAWVTAVVVAVGLGLGMLVK